MAVTNVDDLVAVDDIIMGGQLIAGSGVHTLTNAAGLIDGAKLQANTVDISGGTNLAVTAPVVLTGDTLSAPSVVVGPASATDNAVARYDLTTGKLIQDSVVTIADTTGNMAGVGTLGCGAITSTGAFSATTGAFSSTLNVTATSHAGGIKCTGATGIYTYIVASADNNRGAGFQLQDVGASRWVLGKAETSANFAIRRYTGSAGAETLADTPLTIAAADGVTTLSKTCLFTGTRAVSATGNASSPENAHGTYTPTLTNGTNVASSTAYLCQTHRVGNTITISGVMDVTTSGSGATSIGVSLVVASAFTATTDAAGVAVCANQAVSANPYVFANATHDRLTINFTAASGASHAIWFFVSYTVK